MNSRKLIGYLMIVVAVILTLGIIGRPADLFAVIIGFFNMVLGRLTAVQSGYLIGQLMVWVVHILLTFKLWESGLKRLKSRRL